MIKRILCGLAGTTYTPTAIAQAVALARAHAAEVTGVTVFDMHRARRLHDTALVPWPDSEAVRDRRQALTENNIRQSIHDFEAACAAAQVPYAVVEETGDPFSKLLDLSRYHDLMVFGLRSIFEYDFTWSEPQALLIHLVGGGVRPMLAVADKPREISRVLIAHSGSMESAKAMKRFVQMRLWPGVALHLVTFHPSDEEAYRLLQPAERYCRAHGYTVTHESNPGEAQDLLLPIATLRRADLIVMGNSARRVWLRRVLGDTMLNTLSQAELPLFLAQ